MQVVLRPKSWGFVVEVQYEVKEKKADVDRKKVCCIDLGLNNLCAITSDQYKPILVNGRPLKSINQWYNKKPNVRRSAKRYWRIENYMHHVSKLIVDNCISHGIGTIIIGKNTGWKRNINLGRKTNQAFCFIPIDSLLQKISYKAKLVGIQVVMTEEAYTSKASFIDRDPLPAYERGVEPPQFSGKRVKRGLYKASSGQLVNADVNGACNIGRKVIQNTEFFSRLDRSLAARPVKINPLEKLGALNGIGLVDLANTSC